MSQYSRAYPRYSAVLASKQRSIPTFKGVDDVCSSADVFGCDTFNYHEMSKTLPDSDVKLLKEYAVMGGEISLELANRVALAVKQWATAKGATHYTHWFQPQTESTAEKHDAFLNVDVGMKAIEKFTGELLVRQEPDASSFPSGGRRATFEARGYTVWDASSFMFLASTENGKTLTIPSLFISYSGEALDTKTPLLRSIRCLNQEAVKALSLMEDETSYVTVNCGPEQEFFVIDAALYNLRPDLVLAGKTVLGAPPQKGQQLDDHYFGPINARVINMMMEVEHELMRLGVPIKTRHNEVAPSQFEMAPVYEEANIAADHNRLLMAVLRKVAQKHNLAVLFHEKPFAELNGSGKHLNWSLSKDDGTNLLQPGDKPQENIRFLYFLAAAVKAVHDNGDLLRVSVAVPGNDFRMGSNEAPPAVMSVFLGETLSKVVSNLKAGKRMSSEGSSSDTIDLDIAKIPVIDKDNTDRNRTSPFAFTGNKFEFRALGSSQSISIPITYLNAAITQSLCDMNTYLEAKLAGGASRDQAVLDTVVKAFVDSQAVCFDGDSYDVEWEKEASKRGLSNLRTTPEALEVLTHDNVVDLFVRLGIMSHKQEIMARYNVFMERYVKLRLIELEVAQELLLTQVYPAALSYQQSWASSLSAVAGVLGRPPSAQKKEFEGYVSSVDALSSAMQELGGVIAKVYKLGDGKEAAEYIASEALEALDRARALADKLETVVEDGLWALPRYRELLFSL
ncbi:MAG: glutamine synthetase III [Proteobacteria bacterium]|nr:glutamine synthetase III [Pseudomonadota bacterium]